ncbi:hypothetical protein BG36_07600 [Aquamicrobium defluvii]|uniref:Uncharacterized protein n=1 Tax=Aquamicrobium defluvii TaxID=69279 RepID=A0A011TF27_9HYPH|nr:hypothetical protein BG36_07600 [Aquamicrobium defluvii]EZQ17050.1 hypothetical protein CF98_37155 [Halopseudomonas bauzanensis]
MAKLTPRLKDALAELQRYTEDRNVIYWWRRASMAKLAEIGLAETYRPASVSRTRKMLPYRITPAGRAALTEGKDE